MARLEPGTPLWWATRLYDRLADRQPQIERWSAYYRGDHPLPWLPTQIQDMARRILKMTRTNYMGLVVDATTERQEVLGFRMPTAPAAGTASPTDASTTTGASATLTSSSSVDAEAWRIWQANNLDAISGEAFTQKAICSTVYWMVEPNPDDPKTPLITMEHPAQMYVEYQPGNVRVREAALKVWHDDRTNETMATLYLPDWVYKFRGKRDSKPARWVPREVEGEAWPAANPLGVVPVVEMRNNAQTIFRDGRLTYCGVSEIADVTDVQDRINKTIADRLVTQDFGAFPQMWATGWAEDDDDEDRAAVEAARAAQGLPPLPASASDPAARVNFGRDRIVVANDASVRFGQWAAAPIDPYSTAKNEDVKDIAARTRTPSQYLLGEMINISGEALQSAESGLVSKVKQRSRGDGEALEEVVGLALKVAGDPRDTRSCSTIWRDPQFLTIGQMADAVIKKHLAGLISWEQSLEDLGYTPEQIARIRRQKRQDALQGAALNFDGLFNSPRLGSASASGSTQTPAGAPEKPGDAAAVSAPGNTAAQTPAAPAAA